MWRTTDDIDDSYGRMVMIGFSQAGLSKYAGPGHWNDPDMLEVGNGKMTTDEYKTHMSLWVILAAPLLAGNDLSKMTDTDKSILMNKDAIAIDQDPLGKQGPSAAAASPSACLTAPGARATSLSISRRLASRTARTCVTCGSSRTSATNPESSPARFQDTESRCSSSASRKWLTFPRRQPNES
jgi:hypothetical protein